MGFDVATYSANKRKQSQNKQREQGDFDVVRYARSKKTDEAKQTLLGIAKNLKTSERTEPEPERTGSTAVMAGNEMLYLNNALGEQGFRRSKEIWSDNQREKEQEQTAGYDPRRQAARTAAYLSEKETETETGPYTPEGSLDARRKAMVEANGGTWEGPEPERIRYIPGTNIPVNSERGQALAPVLENIAATKEALRNVPGNIDNAQIRAAKEYLKNAEQYVSTVSGYKSDEQYADYLRAAKQAEEWQNVSRNSDFEEMSRYSQKYVPGTEYLAASTTGSSYYRDTGSEDILYDYINRRYLSPEDAAKVSNIVGINNLITNGTYEGWNNLPEETVKTFNYIYATRGKDEAYDYLNSVQSPGITPVGALALGLVQGVGAPSIGALVGGAYGAISGDETAQQNSRDTFNDFAQIYGEAKENYPGITGAGQTAGNLMLMSLIGQGVGAIGSAAAGAGETAVVGSKAALTATNIARQTASNALTWVISDAVHNAGALSTGNMSGESFARSLGVSAAAGAAGSLAQGLVETGLASVLMKKGLMTPFAEFVRQTTAGTASAGAYVGTSYALSENKPTNDELATQLATAFAFALIGGISRSIATTAADRAAFEQATDAISQRYRQLSENLNNMSPEARAEAAQEILAETQALRQSLNSRYIAGQQQNVNNMNAALDMIEQVMNGYIEGYAYAQNAATPQTALPGSTSMAMTTRPAPAGADPAEALAVQDSITQTLQTAMEGGLVEGAEVQQANNLISEAVNNVPYEVRRDAEGNVYIDISEDILAGKPENEWRGLVRQTIQKIFANGLNLKRGTIYSNRTGRGEFSNGSYTRMLERTDPEMYADKLRMAAGSDGIVANAENYTYENAGHDRTDDIVGFNRGNITVSVKGRGYTGDVLNAIYSDGKETFFDIGNLARKNITETSSPERYAENGFSLASEDASVTPTITQPGTFVNPSAPSVTPELQRDAMAEMQKAVGNSFGKAGAEAAMSAYDPQSAVGMNDYLRDFARTYNAALEGGTATDTVLTAEQYNAAIRAANADRAEALQTAPANATMETEQTAQPAAEVTPYKQAQFEALQNADVTDEWLEPITSAEQIKTYAEAVAADRAEFGTGVDFDLEAAEQALSSGEITVYSPRAITAGAFVTPSRVNAEDMAGGGGRIYSMTVPLDAVAWTDAWSGQYTGKMEDINNGRKGNGILSGNGNGTRSASAGEQTRGMESRAGESESRNGDGRVSEKAEGGRGENARSVAEPQKVSSAQLGVPGGIDSDSVVRVTEYTTEADKAAKAKAEEYGYKLVGFKGGSLHVKGVGAVRACIVNGTTIYARLDHPNFTGVQLIEHEHTHPLINNGAISLDSVRDGLSEHWSEDALRDIIDGYAAEYPGMTPEEAFVEIVCDAQGGMNIFAADGDAKARVFQTFLDDVKAATDSRLTAAQTPSERFSENQDIRFSREILSPEALEEQNEQLRKDLQAATAALARAQGKAAYWEGQTKRSKAPSPDPTDINRLAHELVGGTDTNLKAKDIAPELTELAEFIMRGGDGTEELTFSGVKERAVGIAHRMLENYSELTDSSSVTDYKDIRRRIRDYGTIQVPGNDLPPDWTDFKRRNGWLRLAVSTGTPLDLIYTDLSASYPWFFPEDANYGSDQLYALIDGVRAAEPSYWNPNDQYMAAATEYLANQIIDGIIEDVSQDKTFADRAAKRLSDQKIDAKEKLEAQKEKGQAQLDALRAEKNAQLEQERKRAQYDLAYAVHQTRLAADERLNNLKAHYKEAQENARARRAEGNMRTRLLKIAKRLQDKKLPTPSRALVNEYVGYIDTVAKNMTGKTRDKLQALSELYNYELENNPDFTRDEAIEKKLSRLNAVRISDLTVEQVQDLIDVLLGLEHQLNTAKRELDSADRRDVYQKGVQIIGDVKGGHTVKPQYMETLDNLFVRNTLSPLRELRRQTGYVDGDPLYEAGLRLNRGQLRMNDYVMKNSKTFDEWVQDKEFMESLTGKKAKTIKVRGTGMDGQPVTVEITPDMRISLYLHNRNLQNQQHISSMSGGVKVPDMKLYRAGKISEAYAKGTRIRLQPSEIRAICENMTAKERALAERIYKYFNTTSRNALSDEFERLKGYMMRFVEDYFPIDTDGSFTKANAEAINFDGSLEGSGWLKERVVNAKNPIMLYDATSVLLKAIQAHGQFVGLAVPIRDFTKLYGMNGPVYDEAKNRIGSQSVKETIKQTWGTGATDYIDKMLGDLQKTHTESNSWTDLFRQIRSNYAGATLALNLSVALKQAGSYPTAAAVLGWRPLARAMADFGKVDLDYIASLTPLQWLRSQGYSTPELGDLKAKGRQLPPALNWIQGMDLLTTRKLWKACEYYMQENHPDLKRGSDQYNGTISELYNRVIEETQPNYTVMQRPQLLRSNNELLRDVSMFKTQLFQNFNIFYDAFGNMAAKHQQYQANPNGETKAKYEEAKKNASRASSALIVQSVVIAAMTLAWNALRGKLKRYKDEEKDKITGWSFAKRFGLDVASGFFSMVPFGSEIFSMISSKLTGEKWYGFEGVTTGALTDFFSTIMTAADQIGKSLEAAKGSNTAAIQKQVLAWEDIAENTAKVFGVPAENVMNLIKAVYGSITKTACGKYYGEYLSMLATTPIENNKGKYYDLLYNAEKSGNMDQFWEIYNSMVALDAMASEKKSTVENIDAALKQREKKDK